MYCFSMELAFINTNHPDFKVDTIIQGVLTRRQQNLSSKAQDPQGLQSDLAAQLKQQQGAQTSAPSKDAKQPQQQQGASFAAAKGKAATAPPAAHPQPQSLATAPEKNSSFFGMWFGGAPGGVPTSSTGRPSDGPRFQGGSNTAPKPVKLDAIPTTIQVNAIPKEKEFEIELLGKLHRFFWCTNSLIGFFRGTFGSLL